MLTFWVFMLLFGLIATVAIASKLNGNGRLGAPFTALFVSSGLILTVATFALLTMGVQAAWASWTQAKQAPALVPVPLLSFITDAVQQEQQLYARDGHYGPVDIVSGVPLRVLVDHDRYGVMLVAGRDRQRLTAVLRNGVVVQHTCAPTTTGCHNGHW